MKDCEASGTITRNGIEYIIFNHIRYAIHEPTHRVIVTGPPKDIEVLAIAIQSANYGGASDLEAISGAIEAIRGYSPSIPYNEQLLTKTDCGDLRFKKQRVAVFIDPGSWYEENALLLSYRHNEDEVDGSKESARRWSEIKEMFTAQVLPELRS